MFSFIGLCISTVTHGFLFHSMGHNLFLSLFILMFSFVLDLASRSSFNLAPESFSLRRVILWTLHWIIFSLSQPWSKSFLRDAWFFLVDDGSWKLRSGCWMCSNLLGCCCFEDFSMTSLTPCLLHIFTQISSSWAFPYTLFKMATPDTIPSHSLSTVLALGFPYHFLF